MNQQTNNYTPGDFKPSPNYQSYGAPQYAPQPAPIQPSPQYPQSSKPIAAIFEYDSNGQKIRLTKETVQQYLVGDKVNITDQEFMFFGELCRARKLNPFLREAYLIKYGSSPAQLVVSKDVILKRAVLNPNYDGKESGIIIKNNATGQISERGGCFYDSTSETLLGGWAKIYRKDWSKPEFQSVSLHEVSKKTKDGSTNSNWTTQAATMVEKVAKTRALREAFVEDFAGMYIEDEFNNEPENVKPNVEAIDPMEQQAVNVRTKSVNINDL